VIVVAIGTNASSKRGKKFIGIIADLNGADLVQPSDNTVLAG
jgi:hypothetical protein